MINYWDGKKQIPNNTGKFWILLKKGDNSQNELETEGNFFKLIEHSKNQGRYDTYNVNLKKETERYIVNHKNELKENLITDIPFSVSEIKVYK